ncbi:MAG: phosphohistidine phosphatase SixA [Candidatus Kryptonium sp.]
MIIYLVRHADAEQKKPGMSDFDRSLTELGKETTRKMAIFLKKMNLKIDLIISSPLVRAVQTAEIIRDILQIQSEIVNINELVPGSDFQSLMKVITSFGCENILAVGHEPHLGEFLAWLMGISKPIEFEKNSVACVEVSLFGGSGSKLNWLIHPAMFTWIETI